MCEHHVRGKPEEGVGSPENGVTVVSHHVGSEPQSCGEQPEFLTAEPALSHPTSLLTSNPTKRSIDRPRCFGAGPGLAETGGPRQGARPTGGRGPGGRVLGPREGATVDRCLCSLTLHLCFCLQLRPGKWVRELQRPLGPSIWPSPPAPWPARPAARVLPVPLRQ